MSDQPIDPSKVEIIGLSTTTDTKQVADIVLAFRQKYRDERWLAAKGFGLLCGLVAVVTEEAAVGIAEQDLEEGETIENKRQAFQHYITNMLVGAVKNGMQAAADQIVVPGDAN